jgi:cell division protease FtsH
VPSSIPPVDIPQEIRERALAGAVADESDSGAVLTPPGAGGDIHGAPQPGLDAPVPPHPDAP